MNIKESQFRKLVRIILNEINLPANSCPTPDKIEKYFNPDDVCIITRVEDESILPTKTKETLRELENFPVVILNLYTPKSKHGMNGSSSDKKIIVRMVESRDAIELLPGKSFPDLNPDATVNWHGHSGKKYYIDARYLKKIGKLKNK